MRETTERPEAVAAGTVILVGTDRQKIVDCTSELLHNQAMYLRLSSIHNPYGDGLACHRIIAYLLGEELESETEFLLTNQNKN